MRGPERERDLTEVTKWSVAELGLAPGVPRPEMDLLPARHP